MGHRVLRQAVLIVFACSTSVFAQTDLEQLKSKLQQLEQMMQELKSQIVAAEQQQAPPGQIRTQFGGADELDCGATSVRKVGNGRRCLLYDKTLAMDASRLDPES